MSDAKDGPSGRVAPTPVSTRAPRTYGEPGAGAPRTPGGTNRTGFNPTVTAKDIDPFFEERQAFWAEEGHLWAPALEANPDRQLEARRLIFEYASVGNVDGLIDQWNKRGFNNPNDAGSAGGGGRGRGGGGGGGGGGSLAQQYAAAEAAIRNQAGQMGVPLDEGGIKALAKTVVDGKWSNDQLIDYLEPAATAPGSVTANVDMIKKMAAANLLSVSDATAREWAGRLASDEMTAEGVASLLQAQATQKYGWAASQIGQGVNVRDMLLPTRDLIANELEMNAEEIDLMDPKWLGMVQTVDSKTSETRAATDSEVIMRARKQPQWANTRAAGSAAAAMATRLREYVGG